nr:hypothetical protein [Acidipila rosea]
MSPRNHISLPVNARCRVANPRRSIIIDSKAANDRVNRIALSKRILESLQQNDSYTATEYRSARLLVKGAGMPVSRTDASLCVKVSTLLRQGDGYPTRKCHIALSRE